ncbi:AAA family ATPase [Methanoregula formicica]|uniref:MoxR-like ATPase n=1 Tax=Methanoregula formicica (strain DSM 22288 / NBRC 105244 / SMSP) TaxID=593750 RepID=L0HHB3_METFS|nr:MoxR family ATPase [Methanoregula formicica]AGB02474.1 MoxR-like ATPase [Methanoregula formicica SMSP]
MDHSNLEKKIVDMSRKTGREGTSRHAGIAPAGNDSESVGKETSGRLPLPELKKEVEEISGLAALINERLNEFVVGNHEVIDLILLALLNEGHILVEGVPGTAKTTIAKSIALLTGCSFNRIQGAIDLQPADMLGVRIYDQYKKEFVLRKGPVFTNILLADEINRINPKSQSAFIEAMSERQVTLDGITMPMQSPFCVIATQNPHEFEGTFPLIEVQRDRFMFSIRSDYLNPDEELSIIRRANEGMLQWETYSQSLSPILTPGALKHYIQVIRQVSIEEPVLQYIRDLVIATRTHPDIELGGSSRASLALVSGGKALAALNNRTYVIPDDIKQVSRAALTHRIILSRDAEVEGVTRGQVLEEILSKVEVL